MLKLQSYEISYLWVYVLKVVPLNSCLTNINESYESMSVVHVWGYGVLDDLKYVYTYYIPIISVNKIDMLMF